MTLISRLSVLEDSIGGRIEANLGVPQRLKPVLFRVESLDKSTLQTSYSDYYIEFPYLTKTPNKYTGYLFGNETAGILVTKDDYLLEFGRVPEVVYFLEGNFANNFSSSKNVKVYVNAVYDEETQTLSNYDFMAYVLGILDDEETLWKIILRRDKD
jgi:hypothetical protein